MAKIAIVGAHGTGKTTIWKKVLSYYNVNVGKNTNQYLRNANFFKYLKVEHNIEICCNGNTCYEVPYIQYFFFAGHLRTISLGDFVPIYQFIHKDTEDYVCNYKDDFDIVVSKTLKAQLKEEYVTKDQNRVDYINHIIKIISIYTNSKYFYNNIYNNKFRPAFIPEQFREVTQGIPNFTTQTEDITLATYGKQLYLENLYTAQGKDILCDRSVLDTFVYYDYFNKLNYRYSLKYGKYGHYNNPDCRGNYCFETDDFAKFILTASNFAKTYSKIYLIEPSDRQIEDDGFRLTDKQEQLEIHKLFLEYFKYFKNIEIIDQEYANTNYFTEKVIKEFNVQFREF